MARRASPYRKPKVYKARKKLADGSVATKWVVDLRVYGDKRRRLFFNTQNEAALNAQIEGNKLANEGLRASEVEPGLREQAIRCMELVKGTGLTLEEAVRLGLAQFPRTKTSSLSDAIDHFTESRRTKQNSSRSLGTYRGHLRTFQRAQGAGHPPVHELTTEKIEKYFADLQQAPKTRNNHLGTLKTFFRYCVRRGWCRTNPADALEMAKVPRKPPIIFTPAETAAILNAARSCYPETLGVLAIGMLSGVRSCELLRLETAMVKLDQGIVDVPATISKTKKRRLVPIAENLSAWLGKAKLPEKGRVFAQGEKCFYKKFADIRRIAGVVRKPNAMRHSFATYHLAMYSNVGITSRACGHSVQILNADYDAVTTKGEAEVYWRIFPT